MYTVNLFRLVHHYSQPFDPLSVPREGDTHVDPIVTQGFINTILLYIVVEGRLSKYLHICT